MRLISQNGLFDYPYNSECFIKSSFKENAYSVAIYKTMNSKNGIIFANYSTKEDAEKAITGIIRAKSRGRQFYRFPTEEELSNG